MQCAYYSATAQVCLLTISLLGPLRDTFLRFFLCCQPQIVNVPTAQKSAFCNDFLKIQVRVSSVAANLTPFCSVVVKGSLTDYADLQDYDKSDSMILIYCCVPLCPILYHFQQLCTFSYLLVSFGTFQSVSLCYSSTRF